MERETQTLTVDVSGRETLVRQKPVTQPSHWLTLAGVYVSRDVVEVCVSVCLCKCESVQAQVAHVLLST